MSLLRELQRRNVIRVATAYVVTAWLVIQVIETIFPAFGFSDAAVRIAVIVLGIGFIPAVIGAWVFEWTPEGLKKDSGEGEVPASGSRNLDRAIVVILALGLVYFAFDKFVLAPERAAEREAEVAEEAKAEALTGFYGDRSIAVLPFDNLSSDPEQVYFVDGVAEEILNLLARIRDLRVISRSSSFAFRGQNLEIPVIAERLDVAHILEGSVRRAGNLVRVTAQLIDARTDTHLWSKTYERELDNVFMIQDEIAADVVRNLELTLQQPLPHSRRVDPEVVALVQQASNVFQNRPEDTAPRMTALLERALELDPDYPPAIRWMAVAEWMKQDEGLISREEALARARVLDERYAELVPDSGYLDAARAFDFVLDDDLESAAQLFLSSLEKDLTDSEQVRWASMFARQIGKLDVAVRLAAHAVAIDPLCHQCRRIHSQALMYRNSPGDMSRAVGIREQFLAAAARGGQADYSMMLILNGEPDKVAEVWADLEGNGQGQMAAFIAMAEFSMGQADAARDRISSVEKEIAQLPAEERESRTGLSYRYNIAHALAWMGDADAAFEQLMIVAAADFGWAKRSLFHPAFDGIRNDPRWLEYRVALDASPERFDAIEFDPWLPE